MKGPIDGQMPCVWCYGREMGYQNLQTESNTCCGLVSMATPGVSCYVKLAWEPRLNPRGPPLYFGYQERKFDIEVYFR